MQLQQNEDNQRKIIHIDMDCYYAAIEIREKHSLKNLPVAVGGRRGGRGVLTTCNYVARKYGCRSAMPTYRALELCPQLTILPVRHDLYKEESDEIRKIFKSYTNIIEPISLDEAYLDVTATPSNANDLASFIRKEISEKRKLTCSAGIATNKMLAKIASDWRKPNGQFEVKDEDIEAFLKELPVEKIWGVGGKTSEKLSSLEIRTCHDLQQLEISELHRLFGKFGISLHGLCRGIDNREVISNRERKSCSIEKTYSQDVTNFIDAKKRLHSILLELKNDINNSHDDRKIRSGFVKVKFSDFTKTTSEKTSTVINSELFNELLSQSWARGNGKSVRLIGAGVRFTPLNDDEESQLELF